MKLKRNIYAFFFSLFLLPGLPRSLSAQEGSPVGIRFGYDISNLALYYFEPERVNFEFSADIRIRDDYYPVIEGGWTSYGPSANRIDYTSRGFYLRGGLDYNILNTGIYSVNDMMYLGLRYSVALYDTEIGSFSIPHGYWGEYADSYGKSAVNTHWLEAVAGLRVELFSNFFIGFSLRGRLRIYTSDYFNIAPLYTPGFGKGKTPTAFGFNYSLYYLIGGKGK